MDNLDRMYRHLVRTIRTKFPQYLTQPFDVAALQQTILPYRLHRRELGLETNEDYEIALTELLARAQNGVPIATIPATRRAMTRTPTQATPPQTQSATMPAATAVATPAAEHKKHSTRFILNQVILMTPV